MALESSLNEQKIEYLRLSTRAYNGLKRNGISTIGELLGLTEERLYSFNQMGAKTVAEICEVIKQLRYNSLANIKETEAFNDVKEDFTVLDWAWGTSCALDKCIIYDTDKVIVEDLSITEMLLSNRSQGALHRAGINLLTQLISMKKKEFFEIKNLGAKSVEEILGRIRYLTSVEENDSFANISIDEYIVDFQNLEYEKEIERIRSQAITFLKNALSEDMLGSFSEKCFQQMILSDYFYTLLKSHVCKKVEDLGEAYNDSFKEIFVGRLKLFQTQIIDGCLNDNVIEVKDGSYIIKRPSFKEYVFSIEDERTRECLVLRAKGHTLEEVGEMYGITRERVRQITAKGIRRRPVLKEDMYVSLYENYAFSPESMQYILKMDEFSKLYYEIVGIKKGTKDIELLLEDEKVTLQIKGNVEKYLYRNYLDVSGEKIKCDRATILDYLIRTHCKDEVSVDYLQKLYGEFVINHGISDNPEISYPDRYFTTKLAKDKNVLWKFGMKLRYYSLSDEEFLELLEAIQFNALSDIEISTNYFFINYPEEMKLFDIRDEYELHNLLKKRLEGIRADVTFLRMPNIAIGNADREMQVLNLLIQEAPISNYELAAKYEALYGVQSATVLANYFKCIDEYFYKGEYSIDFEELTTEEYDYLSNELVDDIYEIDYVKKIFRKQFPFSSLGKISSYSVKRLGFRVSVNLIYRSDASNTDKFFRSYLHRNEILDLSNRTWILKNQSAYNILYEWKRDFEVIEFAPYKYIFFNKLASHISGKEELQDYGRKACEFARGRFFSVYSLKNEGFTHRLDTLGFDDFFYASIIRFYMHGRCCKLDNQYIFREGYDLLENSMLIQDVISRNGAMNVYDLIEYLKMKYGICIDKYKVCKLARDAELFYSETMEKVYRDYDEFFEEV